MDALNQLTATIGEVVDLQHAAALIEWDEQVYMPRGGAPVHGDMVATIKKTAHQKFTSDEVGRLLEDAAHALDGLDDDSNDRRTLRVTARDYAKARRVPAEFVADQAQAVSAAQQAWIEARSRSDYAHFRPHLERLIALKKQYIGFFPPAAHPYDVLLDDFEPGVTTADVTALFATIRPRQVALIQAIAGRPQVDDSFLRVSYDERELWAFGEEVITAFGFDWTRGRQDRSVHPFATGIGPDDVRITTRMVEQEPFSLFFGTAHETGHALYEQGIDGAFRRSLLGNAASLGLHESQSRLWENLVARSRPFWEHFYPKLQARCPAQLGRVSRDQFYRGINKVERTLIRVESDEATYNLHIMLRVEMEIAMLTGGVAARDLPEMWNARMQEYLGLTPGSDATGILQDIHWSIGAMGYFATYTLGNLISAQLWDAFGRAHPDRDEQLRRGNFEPLLRWLRDQVHRYGRKYEPQELVLRVTGSKIDPEPYLRYLETKYGEIYGV
ncbi:MAG TPA: carboxypeptidase M32 [Gemmatimonadaceae bacterium]